MIRKTGIRQILATVILLGRFKLLTSKIYACFFGNAFQSMIDGPMAAYFSMYNLPQKTQLYAG